MPRQVEMSGIMVDMDAVANSLWAKNNDKQLTVATGQQIGMMTSAWEHKIPEMLFTSEENPGKAVSAVKALAIASAEGQRIYQVTKENVDVVLPVLNIDSKVKDEIRDSVTVGKVATVSQNTITVGSWTGVGYIIADSETGAGAYRISGGKDGAETTEDSGTLQEIVAFFSGLWTIIIAAFKKILYNTISIVVGAVDVLISCWDSKYLFNALLLFAIMTLYFWVLGYGFAFLAMTGPFAGYTLLIDVFSYFFAAIGMGIAMYEFKRKCSSEP